MATQPAMKASLVGMTVALAVASLSGCGSNPVEDAAQNKVDDSVEKAIEDSVEGDTGDDVDLDIGDDVAVPDDFPSELPLPDGTLVASVAMEQGWQLSYEVDGKGEAEDVAAHFAADDAFEEVANSSMGGIQSWTYTSDTYSVTIGFIDDGPASQMSYLVVRIDA